MNPDCPYCGFKDNATHPCFPDSARQVIDQRTAWYHEEWRRAEALTAQGQGLKAALKLCLDELQEARQHLDYGIKTEFAIAKAEAALNTARGGETP